MRRQHSQPASGYHTVPHLHSTPQRQQSHPAVQTIHYCCQCEHNPHATIRKPPHCHDSSGGMGPGAVIVGPGKQHMMVDMHGYPLVPQQYDPMLHQQVSARLQRGSFGNEDIRKSLEHLDQILDQYDDTGPEPPLPPPPQELLQSRPGSLDPTATKRQADTQRRPPPLPTRSPDTRLSSASDNRDVLEAVPAPDYEDEQGPESGYITPDQTSESDYPIIPQQHINHTGAHMNAMASHSHQLPGGISCSNNGGKTNGNIPGHHYQRQHSGGDPSRPSHHHPHHPHHHHHQMQSGQSVDLNQHVPAAGAHGHVRTHSMDLYDTHIVPRGMESRDYTYQISDNVSIVSTNPVSVQKDASFRGGDEAYSRTIAPAQAPGMPLMTQQQHHSRQGVPLPPLPGFSNSNSPPHVLHQDTPHLSQSPHKTNSNHSMPTSPTQMGVKLIPAVATKPLRKVPPPSSQQKPTETDADHHALPFKVRLKPVSSPKTSKVFGVSGVAEVEQEEDIPIPPPLTSKAPVPLPKGRRSPSPPPPPPELLQLPPPPPPPFPADEFPEPPPPSFSPPPPPLDAPSFPTHNSNIPPPPPVGKFPLPPPPPPAPPSVVSSSHSTSSLACSSPQRVSSPPAAPPLPPGREKLPDLLSQIQNISLSETEKPSKPTGNQGEGRPEGHSALINQIQSGIKLKSTPGGRKLTDDNSTNFESTPVFRNQSSYEDPPLSPVSYQSSNDRRDSDSSSSSGGNQDNRSPNKTAPPTAPKANHGIRMPANFGDDDIDITQLPGFQVAPDGCPSWKRAMIEKKNMQLFDEAKRAIAYRRAEEEKWKDVPEWKRHLIIEKEKKKKEENAPIEVQKRRQEEEIHRIQNMPDWKRQILLKKKTDS